MAHCSYTPPPAESSRAATPATFSAAISESPSEPVARETSVSPERAQLSASGGTQRTLLVVDDQPSVCASIAYYLEISGYRTLKAESGQAALELLNKEQIDGVLLDVQMPKLNGFETCIRLHELARATNRPLKIWFMTGVYYRELKDACAKAGGLAVFQKPFDWPNLLAELKRSLTPAQSPPDQGAASESTSAPA